MHKYAADREPVYRRTCSDAEQSQLSKSWIASAKFHSAIREALVAAKLSSAVQTVAVSGSLGRMEVVDGSDCDLIVVLSDEVLKQPEQAAKCFEHVLRAIEPLGLATSKAGGIFSVPTSADRLCDPSMLGVIDEDMATFGHRIQLLIDSQPVYGFDRFRQLQQSILERYAAETIEHDHSKQWTYLLNDLMRYHRSLCVRTQWATRQTPGQWRLLNLKLWHSRLLNYAGLLFLLGECSTESTDKTEWLAERLPLTPLERVIDVFGENDDPTGVTIVDSYNRFLSFMNNPDDLAGLAVDDRESRLPDDHARYQSLRDNSRMIVSALSSFVFNQRHWDSRFNEILLF